MGDPSEPTPQQPGSEKAPPPSSKINVIDVDTAIKATRLLAAELGAKKLKLGMPGQLSEQDWRKQFQRHQVGLEGKVDQLQQSAKLGPSSLKKNELDNVAKEIYTELRSMAVAASCLEELDPDNVPLLDNTKVTNPSSSFFISSGSDGTSPVLFHSCGRTNWLFSLLLIPLPIFWKFS